jgi:hypothetical protein
MVEWILAQTHVDLANKPTALNLFAGGIVVVLSASAAVGYFGYRRNLGSRRIDKAGLYFAYLVWGTVAFQAVHTLEHILQVGFWIRRPYYQPWLSPWALAAQKGLTNYFDPQARPQTGNELLHLLGNLIFFFGLLAINHALRVSTTSRRDRRFSLAALAIQGIHVTEHVLLTTTWYLTGVPRGASTLFGYAFTLPAPWAPGIRIVWHFLANFLPMTFVLLGLGELRRAGLLSEKGFAEAMGYSDRAAGEIQGGLVSRPARS